MEGCVRWGNGKRVRNVDLGKSMLMEAALHCLAEKGYSAFTMQDVAEAASVSRRTVYRYFPCKDEMLHEIIRYGHERAFLTMRRAAERYADDFYAFAEEAVVAGVKYYLEVDSETEGAVKANEVLIKAHTDHDILVMRWERLLRTPYQNYLEKHPDARMPGMLRKFAELATLFVTGHCQLHSTEQDIRKSFEAIMVLASHSLRSGRRPVSGSL